jgi:hypothetical protein
MTGSPELNPGQKWASGTLGLGVHYDSQDGDAKGECEQSPHEEKAEQFVRPYHIE